MLTVLSPSRVRDLGLEKFSVSKLFSNILMMGFFLLACILQLHYFHDPFMLITDLEHVRPPSPAPCHIPRWDPVLGDPSAPRAPQPCSDPPFPQV